MYRVKKYLFENLNFRLNKHQQYKPNEDFFIAIDGLSGSGKSTIAKDISMKYNATIFHIDNIVPGWYGLRHGISIYVDTILKSLRLNGSAQFREWDWHNAQYTSIVRNLNTQSIIIFEGVGACDKKAIDFLNFTIWIDCEEYKRKQRVQKRDKSIYSNFFWHTWKAQEKSWLKYNTPKQYADFVLKNN